MNKKYKVTWCNIEEIIEAVSAMEAISIFTSRHTCHDGIKGSLCTYDRRKDAWNPCISFTPSYYA